MSIKLHSNYVEYSGIEDYSNVKNGQFEFLSECKFSKRKTNVVLACDLLLYTRKIILHIRVLFSQNVIKFLSMKLHQKLQVTFFNLGTNNVACAFSKQKGCFCRFGTITSKVYNYFHPKCIIFLYFMKAQYSDIESYCTG